MCTNVSGVDLLCYRVCGGLLMVTVHQQALVNSGHAPSLTNTLVEEEQVLRDSLERRSDKMEIDE